MLLDAIRREVAYQDAQWAELVARSETLASLARELPADAVALLHEAAAQLRAGAPLEPSGTAGSALAAHVCRV